MSDHTSAISVSLVVALSLMPSQSTHGQTSDLPTQSAYAKALPDGPGTAATLRVWGTCHDIEEVSVERLSRKGWEAKIDEMFRAGAVGTDRDVALALDYLAATFPARLDINKAITMEFERYLTLSERDGDAIVACRQQHGPFKKWQDLQMVPGVDFKKIRENSEILFVDLSR